MIYAHNNLTITGMISGGGIHGVRWKRNGDVITNNRNGYMLSQQYVAESRMVRISLETANSTSKSYSGSYQLVVNALVGTAVVGEWVVREAGEEGRGGRWDCDG
jgi:hypothetical protein